MRDGGPWESDVRTPTRIDEDPSLTLRLARVRDGRIEPYAHAAAPDETWRAWRLSEVSVSARRVGGEAIPEEHVEAARAAKVDWTRYDSDKVLVVLEGTDAENVALIGTATSRDEHGREHVYISYDPSRGVDIRDGAPTSEAVPEATG